MENNKDDKILNPNNDKFLELESCKDRVENYKKLSEELEIEIIKNTKEETFPFTLNHKTARLILLSLNRSRYVEKIYIKNIEEGVI